MPSSVEMMANMRDVASEDGFEDSGTALVLFFKRQRPRQKVEFAWCVCNSATDARKQQASFQRLGWTLVTKAFGAVYLLAETDA